MSLNNHDESCIRIGTRHARAHPRLASPVVPVAFVTTSMGIGGAERLLVELINRIDRTRFEPILICLKEADTLGEELSRAGVRVHACLSRHRLDLGVVGRLASVLRGARVQVVCTVGSGGDRSFWGRIAARFAGVPVVVSSAHSMGIPDRFEPHNRLLNALTDAFIATAHLQRRYLVQAEGIPAAKVRVIYNGVDLARFRPGFGHLDARREFGIPPEAPLAAVVAYLRPEKNLEMFLNAAARVHRQIPRAHFLIVGDGPERSRLEATARSLALHGTVHFAGLRDRIHEWVCAADLIALTSRCEAFPVSLLEAMACGKPVVATRVGAIPEMVVPGTTGHLITPGDHRAMADAMCELLADPVKAKEIGIRGRNHVERHFDINNMVRGYESLFDCLLAKKVSVGGRCRDSRPPLSPDTTPSRCAQGSLHGPVQSKLYSRFAEEISA